VNLEECFIYTRHTEALDTVTASDQNGLLPASERGVSPVVGILLKVALAVILAAVTITVTFTLLPETDPTPQVTVGVEQDPGSQVVEFTHLGGDTVDSRAVAIEGPGVVNRATLGSELESGDTIRVENVVASPGDTISLVWVTESRSVIVKEVTISVPFTGGNSPVSGDVTILDDVDESDTQFDVKTTVRNASSAYLAVRNLNTGGEETFPNVGNETVTVTSLSLNAGDQLRAELYESSSRSNRLDSANEAVDSTGGGGGPIPGFSFPAVVLAIVLVALLSRRRRDRETDGGEQE
jgi:MYXO-CTERM domain-containing protein